MGGLPKQHVYLAVIAALLLLWRSSARAEAYRVRGKGWVQFSGRNIQDATAEYIPDGNLRICKNKCSDDEKCVGLTIQKHTNSFVGGATKCWLLKRTNDDIMLRGVGRAGYVNENKITNDQTKTLWLKKQYTHTSQTFRKNGYMFT